MTTTIKYAVVITILIYSLLITVVCLREEFSPEGRGINEYLAVVAGPVFWLFLLFFLLSKITIGEYVDQWRKKHPLDARRKKQVENFSDKKIQKIIKTIIKENKQRNRLADNYIDLSKFYSTENDYFLTIEDLAPIYLKGHRKEKQYFRYLYYWRREDFLKELKKYFVPATNLKKRNDLAEWQLDQLKNKVLYELREE